MFILPKLKYAPLVTHFRQISQSQSVRSSSSTNRPLLRFGVITDTHYADRDDRPAWYDSQRRRFYRFSLEQIERAFKHWTLKGDQLVLHLGDIIDGANLKMKRSDEAFERVISLFEFKYRLPAFYVIGNHELYNFRRSQIPNLYHERIAKNANHFHSFSCSNEEQQLYYSLSPKPGIKLIIIDCYDISGLGYDKSSLKYKKASKVLFEKHRDVDIDVWDSDGTLHGLNRRFQLQNGAMDSIQLQWLNHELEKADENDEKVIVFGHVGIHPQSVDSSCLLWNYEQILAMFAEHSSVKLYLCGHSHRTGYACDENGVHYVSLNGVIETQPEMEAFVSVSLYENEIIIEGLGSEKSRVLLIRT
ncbi:manganese-dependent ADP-ribose/CDP-alcohol diphosphatase-like isoform X1 [Dinothrombium tinctorium]|uniref:Manganese-dependent ADP-ribose/CDP-alcohol diphosphatase-like isoform X1 n=1 Tax=Dinothrombium tinctorium TaxID=1965070 RepID=A0A3S3SJJ7_9ACAR|nr:manganese-dependent ADP-ribose/CDP-alcohol diphosphatase-like isoform X1 [Dinothrombium tinctorium]RWS16106.1 manganese-dependent ADP-ribose/CDP-alcohol diphosphatase-like isoform X1 [Dinothrombium tinctorium]